MTKLNDDNQESPLDQAVQEFVDARLRGEQPDIDEFVRRYPDLGHEIREKIGNLRKIDTLFNSLVQADERDFEETASGQDLIGQKVGSFEVIELIGRGGMGLVYLARDTKLDRSVAIKSMPAELQASSTARARFVREAKLLASLSHPNIAVIHDILELVEGSAYLVLEYVPGETLAERMTRESLTLEDSLSIGLQIAEAVCAAHEEGVIHRDLKPSNIKIMPDGRVKVLDFGLAKTTVGKSVAADPTVTQPGRIMGTPAYMSPEQARGKPTDRRTDIWSFGCLLYEMLTGHLPFEGETTTDILARIIERDPNWNPLPQTTPVNIRVLLWRCLAKDARRRFQHMGDIILELDETLNLPTDKPSIAEPAVTTSGRSRWRLAILCTVAGLIVGLIAASVFLRKPDGPSLAMPTYRFKIGLPENQVLGVFQSASFGQRLPAFALSRDGSRLVYVAHTGKDTQLFLRPMDDSESELIPGTDGANSPFFKPDGQSVGFFANGKLMTVSLPGVEPVPVCDAGYLATGSWGDDDMIYFTGRSESGLSRVPADGGVVEPLETDSGRITGFWPQVLPGAEVMLISSSEGAVHVSLETMKKTLLREDASYARYVPTGHLVYMRAGAIQAVPCNLTTFEVTDPPVPVILNVLSDSVYGIAQFAFSDDGLLVYIQGSDTGKTIPTWVDLQGNEESLDMDARFYGALALSPDGKRLAIAAKEQEYNIYIYDLERKRETRLTREGTNNYPLWTPDNTHVLFSHYEEADAKWHILLAPSDGSRDTISLHSSEHQMKPYSWSSDGKLLALYELSPTTGWDISVLPMKDGSKPRPILNTEFGEWGPAFSPDDRYIAYTSSRDVEPQIYIRPYPDVNDRAIRISVESGEEPIWSADGDKLFFRNGHKWMVASVSTEPELDPNTPEMVFEGRYGNVDGLSYDVAPDGRFLVLAPQYDDSKVRELKVITNWFEELERRVPSPKTP